MFSSFLLDFLHVSLETGSVSMPADKAMAGVGTVLALLTASADRRFRSFHCVIRSKQRRAAFRRFIFHLASSPDKKISRSISLRPTNQKGRRSVDLPNQQIDALIFV